RGGMGAVYLARRADGQFDQQVAIKLIDLPLAGSLFRERFRQERQILAGLSHPFIARLLDGGVSEDGELYLAMEYADGLPIQRYCTQHSLGIRERIGLETRQYSGPGRWHAEAPRLRHRQAAYSGGGGGGR